MSDSDRDRAEAKIDEVKGRAKETWGAATGDNETRISGQADQAKAAGRETVADAKDALHEGGAKAKGLWERARGALMGDRSRHD